MDQWNIGTLNTQSAYCDKIIPRKSQDSLKDNPKISPASYDINCIDKGLNAQNLKKWVPLDLYWHIITTRAPDGANKGKYLDK